MSVTGPSPEAPPRAPSSRIHPEILRTRTVPLCRTAPGRSTEEGQPQDNILLFFSLIQQTFSAFSDKLGNGVSFPEFSCRNYPSRLIRSSPPSPSMFFASFLSGNVRSPYVCLLPDYAAGYITSAYAPSPPVVAKVTVLGSRSWSGRISTAPPGRTQIMA